MRFLSDFRRKMVRKLYIQAYNSFLLPERAFESYEDRVIAKKAVEIVLNATRKRPGFKGAVSICTEVTSLLQKNRK